jgi:hypothetical protein
MRAGLTLHHDRTRDGPVKRNTHLHCGNSGFTCRSGCFGAPETRKCKRLHAAGAPPRAAAQVIFSDSMKLRKSSGWHDACLK